MFILILICDYIIIVVIFPSSGNINVCLGETRTFTCNVTGAVFLVWEYDFGVDALFSSSDNNTGPLTSDIDVQLVSRAGGLQVRAIVNVTSDINGKTLRCRNTPGDTGSTISRDIIFNVQSNCTNNSLTTPLCPLNVLFTLCIYPVHLHPPIASIPQSGRVWSTDLVDQVVPLAW